MLFCMELFIGFPLVEEHLSSYMHLTLEQNSSAHYPHLVTLNHLRSYLKNIMKDYGVQESRTKTLVVEGLYLPTELANDVYEPLVFLRNGDILLCYNDWIVVCYNQGTKSLRETRVARTQSHFRAIGYNPCFFSLHDVAKGEGVKRVRDKKNSKKPFGEGSSGCADSGIPQKSKKLNSGSGLPA